MNALISIIIPVYNGENHISIPLDSLKEQQFKDFEVIIIDDGSIDKTADVVKRYTQDDTRYKYYYQDNQGVSAARNNGIKQAIGEYICFLDSDDYYDKSFLEKLYSKITDEDADICYCGYKIVTPQKTIIYRSIFKKGNILIEYILGKASIHITDWMIKKELINKHKIHFLQGVSWGEDFEFFCELLSVTNNITYVKDYLTYYRRNFEQQLSTFNMDKLDQDFESIKRVKNNPIINNNTKIEKALLNHRLPALLTYRLLEAFNHNVGREDILNYLDKYKVYLNKNIWNNGLRSIKLSINKLMLFYKTNKLRRM